MRVKQLSCGFVCRAQVLAGFSGHGHSNSSNYIKKSKKINSFFTFSNICVYLLVIFFLFAATLINDAINRSI